MPKVLRDGVSIHYLLHGEAGDPVLLLMGLGVDSGGWELQVPALAKHHRVIVVDNRGVGRSDKPPGPYTIAQLADDAAAVLGEALPALQSDRAHVVGLSMGGMIAQELALRHPEQVGALVLAATYARPGREVKATSEQGSTSVARTGMMQLLQGSLDLATVDVRQVMAFLMPLVFSPQFLVNKRDWLKELFERAMSNGFSLQSLLAQVAAVLSHDTTARLPSLTAPTLILTGTADRLVPPRHADELHNLIPGARLEKLDGATHGFNFEQPEAFNRAVLDFLAAHPVAARGAAVG